MSPVTQEFLSPVLKVYDEMKQSGTLEAPAPEQYRNFCISVMIGRMEVLPENDPEYKECAFIVQVLRNGWLASDIPALSKLYTVSQDVNAAFKPEANKILGQYATVKIKTLADRYEMTKITDKYWVDLQRDHRKHKQTAQEQISGIKKAVIFPCEYPQDPDFAKTAGTPAVQNGVSFGIANPDDFAAIQTQRARENTEYIIGEVREITRTLEKERQFVPNEGQSYNKITKSTSKAITETLGDSVYDEIEEMTRGTVEERKVRLHHALGTKYQKEGCDVLEMDFAGSGGQDVYKPYKDRKGSVNFDMSPEKFEATYGIQAKKPDGKPFDYIFYKEKPVEKPDGTSVMKKRYTFPGPTPDIPYISGLPNLGEYSIENSREYARRFAQEFLEPRFQEWLAGGKPRPIHIDLTGHSRGAVTAGQAAKKIDRWIQQYMETHPDAKAMNLKQYIHYDLLMRDPVPGVITNMHMGSCDLTKIPNMNAVVFCTVALNAPDVLLPLQHVKGAKKVILTVTDHLVDQEKTDSTQKNTFGDGKDHAMGYYDAETGEMYRGSGLNELPDGVYISDEKHALIRMTSYSQVNEFYGAVFDKSKPQRVRSRRIHKMVRDWFIENELETSFPDEQTRKTEEAKNNVTRKKILKVDAWRIRHVKAELQALNELKKTNPTKEQLIEQNNKLIKVCREYMKDTTMPPKGETAYKVGLVADTLSYTMRENNQLKKEIAIEKGEEPNTELEDRIRAHKKRLEEKPGYLKRKMEAETKRLEQEKKILKLIADTKKKCRETLDTLDKTRIGESNSSTYKKMHDMLEEGTRLGNETSVNDMADFLKRFSEATKSYTRTHGVLGDPITHDGIIRLNESKDLTGFGKEAAENLEKLAAGAGLGERNVPVGIKAADRSARIEQMKARQEELKAQEEQKAREKTPAADPAGPAAVL